MQLELQRHIAMLQHEETIRVNMCAQHAQQVAARLLLCVDCQPSALHALAWYGST